MFLCVCRVFTVALLFNTLKGDCPSYQIIGDNGDLHVLQHTSHQSMVRKVTIGFMRMLLETVSQEGISQTMLPLLMWPHYPYKSSCHQLEIAVALHPRASALAAPHCYTKKGWQVGAIDQSAALSSHFH